MLPREPNILAPKSLTDALELCFERSGASVAIDTPDFKMTYAELDGMSRHVASELRERFSLEQLKSKPIAILMSRSVEFYVAQIAVIRAGGFFLPIDPSQPPERIEFLLSDSLSSLLLVRERDSFVVESAVVSFSIDVDRWMKGRQDYVDQPPTTAATDACGEISENDFAYMIYTSGSRGRPKGVPISHQAICNLCHWWSDEFELAAGQRTLQMISVGFDASLEEILPTLVSGGTLVPIQPEAMNSMKQFLNFIERENVQNLHLPAAFWHALAASFEMHDSLKLPASVQTVVLGGEKADPTLVESWFAHVGTEVRLINAYGPTETTVAASYAVLRPGAQPTIGQPIRNVSFCVCDADGQLVKSGTPGELYIGGIGVATGYWNREKLTAEKFVDSPLNDNQRYYRTGDRVQLNEDGNCEFIGRIDDQVKIRGYRIEPGEVSACLGAHPQVSQAHVAARQLTSGTNALHLFGYVIAKSDDDPPSESDLAEFLSRQLPAYMIPTRIVVMESFPVTPGGKLDLERFPSPTLDPVLGTDQDGGGSEPVSPTEQKIAKLWKKVLGTGGLTREANFFQIGGDSLSAMRLVLLLESEFPGAVIPVAALIPNPTIATLADYIDHRQGHSTAKTPQNWPFLTPMGNYKQPIRIVCIHAAGGGGMFYRELFEGFEPLGPVAILESASLYQEELELETCGHQSIAEMAQNYVDCVIDAGCEQKLTLVGYSFGALLSFEMARLLKAKGYDIEKIINIDCPSPVSMRPRNRFSKFWCRVRSHETFGDWLAEHILIKQRKREIKRLKKFQKENLQPPVELRPLALELVFGDLAVNHVTKPLDVTMHLIRGQYPQAMYHIPEDYGWPEMVSTFSKEQIPGGHNTIFCHPYLKLLVETFHEALRE